MRRLNLFAPNGAGADLIELGRARPAVRIADSVEMNSNASGRAPRRAEQQDRGLPGLGDDCRPDKLKQYSKR
jgi:hypothetical protein